MIDFIDQLDIFFYVTILTSHTLEVAKFVTPDQLILLRRNEDGHVVTISNTTEKIKGVVEELGILPYAAPKTVIFVEGENDLNFLMNLNQSIPELKAIIDLKEEEIPIIPLHGGNLTVWFNRDYFKKSSLTQIYITDRQLFPSESPLFCCARTPVLNGAPDPDICH